MQNSLSLLDIRQSLNLTQVQIADMLDITAEYVSMIENNKKTASKKVLNKLESLLAQSQKSLTFKPPPTTCPLCTTKDKELYQARNIIEMQAKTISDQAQAICELITNSNPNGHAALVSGVGIGGMRSKHTKEREAQ